MVALSFFVLRGFGKEASSFVESTNV